MIINIFSTLSGANWQVRVPFCMHCLLLITTLPRSNVCKYFKKLIYEFFVEIDIFCSCMVGLCVRLQPPASRASNEKTSKDGIPTRWLPKYEDKGIPCSRWPPSTSDWKGITSTCSIRCSFRSPTKGITLFVLATCNLNCRYWMINFISRIQTQRSLLLTLIIIIITATVVVVVIIIIK